MITQLKQRLSEDVSFRKEMEQIQYKYQMILQKSIYSDLSQLNQNIIVKAGRTLANHQLFFVFGSEMPQINKINSQKIFMYIVKWLQQELEKGLGIFTIIYFHTNCNSYNSYLTLRKIFRSMPLKFYDRFKSFVLMNPSFTIRAMQWFVSGTLNKHLNNITTIAHSFKDLRKMNIIISSIDKKIFPKQIWQQLYSGLPIDSKNNLVSTKTITTQVNNTCILNPLKTIAKINSLDDYQTNQIGIPLIFEFLIGYFILKPNYLKEQGLFRKSVSVDDMSEATLEIQLGNYDYINDISNPHLVANLIKRSLADLKDPIMTYQIYDQLTHDNGRSNQINYIKALMQQLPLKNYVTLVYIFNFFIDEVIPLSEFNKMSYYNVAVVLAPCLMRSAKNAIQDLIYSKKIVLTLQFILQHSQQIFGKKQDKQNLFRQSAKIQQDKFYRQSLGVSDLSLIQSINIPHKKSLNQPPNLKNMRDQQFNRFYFLDQSINSITKKRTIHEIGNQNEIQSFKN